MHVIIADDHILFRDGLGKIINTLDADIRLYEAGNIDEVFTLLDRPIFFSLILLDLDMPGMKGIETIQKIKSKVENPIVIVSGLLDTNLIKQFFKEGIAGFIPKTMKSEVMLGALKLILSGGVYMPESLFAQNDEEELEGIGHVKITKRQRDVLQEVAKGSSNREVAETLSISEYTVRIHVISLLKAFDARNRTHLVVLAREKGFLP